ncbi:hypothetical protein MNBD_GAMMA07-454 [hydrothermal vent metagenome]|uniref:Uncharacterized protein n=1 Tax=hydrothermal vent metagenome TaxID=652676 RepID=A0A3B0X2Q8_9ZZZZ
MRQNPKSISKIVNHTRNISEILFIENTGNYYNKYERKSKIIRYSEQLTDLLALLPNADNTSDKNIAQSIRECNFGIKSMAHESINLEFKKSEHQTHYFKNNNADEELIDDYLTVIGELIHGLYQLHIKNFPLDKSIR